jgi:predicted phosphoribosyltransferase
MIFNDRVEAGNRLASVLMDYAEGNTVILAVPRGGVVVGYQIALKLGAPLDIIVPRKIGAPNNPELAIGAVAEDGTVILDHKLVEYLRVDEKYIRAESERQRLEIKRRLNLYRGKIRYPNMEDRDVVIVDDGIATGATVRSTLSSIL